MDHVHVVLDEQDGAPFGLELMDVVEQALFERRVDARHRLVEHDQPGVGHQRPRHLQELALTTREVAGELVAHVIEAEALEQLVGAFGVLLLLVGPREPPRRRPHTLADLAGGAEAHVLHHRQAGKRLGQLERADHADAGEFVRRATGDLLAVEVPLPVVGVVEPGEQVEQRCLAGAVGSDQGGDLAALHLDVVDVDGDEPTELTPHRVGDEDRIGLGDTGLSLRGPLVHVGNELSGHRTPARGDRRRCPADGR